MVMVANDSLESLVTRVSLNNRLDLMVSVMGSKAILTALTPKQAKLFKKSQEKLTKYIRHYVKHGGGNACLAVNHLKLSQLTKPTDQASGDDATDTKI